MPRWCLLALLLTPGLAQPPQTKVQNVAETIHGVTITDPYRWLEDQNSPDTRAWIGAQMKYTQSVLAKIAVRERIHQRLTQLMKIDTMGVPVERGGRYFFGKRAASQNQSVLYVRQDRGGKDEVLVDPNPLSKDQTTSANMVDVSRDGKLFAYGLRQGGEDETTIAFLNVDTREKLPDQLPRGRYFNVAINSDRSGFYYSVRRAEGSRVYYHAFGSGLKQDADIFGKGYGPTEIIECGLSEDGRYLLIQVEYGASADKVEVYVQNVAAKGPIQAIVKDLDARFQPDFAGDRLYMMTNWNAPNNRIVAVDLKNPAHANWKEVVPEGKNPLDSFYLVGGKLVINTLENVTSRIHILDLDGKPLREVALPTLGTAVGPFGRWSSDEAFHIFSSFGQPATSYRYEVSSGKQEVWFQPKVPFDPSTIEVQQVWYESKDKTRVPMFVAHRKGLKLDGSHPTVLTGYGGFDLPTLPAFSAGSAAWLDMGGIFAAANLRGGGEFGEAWHKAGMLDKKQTVFDDFIAAAEYLIRNGYTQRSKLAILGGSNGGLLVGAAMTQRPDRFQAVVCAAPLLDMVRYHLFKVAKFWVPEYGSSEDLNQFKFLYAYSPYHHVKKGEKYPAVMFITGDADTRVDPLHGAK